MAYLVVAIRRHFSIVDFDMVFYRIFIFRKREINASKRDLVDKRLYMFEGAFLRAEEETNLIRNIEAGEME